MEKKISIIMPTFNRIKTIGVAINSVLNQSYENWELLIVNDYGKDETKKYIETNYGQDKRIKFIENNRKKGISGARNMGVLNAKGEYIAFIDSDDEWEKNHLRDLLGAMLYEEKDLGFALWKEGKKNNLIGIDDNDSYKVLFKRSLKELNAIDKEKYTIYDKNFFEYTMITYFYCYHINTMIIKKSLLDKIGIFNEKLNSSEDVEFLFRAISESGFILYKDYHYNYYQNEDSTYAFIDRNSITVDEIINDKKIIDNLTKLGLDKIKVRKISIDIVNDSSNIKDREKILEIINNAIYRKLLTLGFINMDNDREKAFVYLNKAYSMNSNSKVKNIIDKLDANDKNKFKLLKKEELDIW